MNPFSSHSNIYSFKQLHLIQHTDARRLRDIPEDVLQLFIENLDLRSIINLVESDDYLLQAANWGFRVKYGRKIFDISKPFTDDPSQFILEPSSKLLPRSFNKRDTIHLRDFETILKVLKYFGGSITKLMIEFEVMHANEIKSILEYIRVFCTKLTTFDIRNGEEADIDQMHPMPTVQNVSITVVQLENMGELIERIFPNMKRLDIKNFQVTNPQCLAHHFPSLEHLDVSFFINGFRVSHIEDVVKMNPQIRSLRLHMCPVEFMKVIKNNLPNIESLELVWPLENFFQPGAKVVHFENMKTIAIDGLFKLIAFPFTFNPAKLKELRIGCISHFNKNWIDFIMRHKHLTKLEITRVRMSETELMRFAHELTNLNEFSADFGRVTETNHIITFLEKCKDLHELRLFSPKNQVIDVLRERLVDKWDIYYDTTSEHTSWIVKRRSY